MNFLDFLDRMGERRLRRALARPPRPTDWKSFAGVFFLGGYYFMVYTFVWRVVPAANVALVRDAMLVLGPAVGAIVQSMFRSDVRDEIQAGNTALGFQAMRSSAEATKAAAEGTPPAIDAKKEGAQQVADAAVDEAANIGAQDDALPRP